MLESLIFGRQLCNAALQAVQLPMQLSHLPLSCQLRRRRLQSEHMPLKSSCNALKNFHTGLRHVLSNVMSLMHFFQG